MNSARVAIGPGPGRATLSPLQQSFLIHALVILGFLGARWFFLEKKNSAKNIVVEVYENPKVAITPLKIENVKPKPIEPPPAQKAVFGAHRNALTSASSESGLTIKAGNTVAKENDNLKLNPDDATNLPIPTDDYLVSKMPSLISEFRIPYPEEARRQSIEGAVVMDLLIDATGIVRKVELVQGPGHGLNEAALDAITKFKFSPAMVDQKPVAVKIRYTYRFILETQ